MSEFLSFHLISYSANVSWNELIFSHFMRVAYAGLFSNLLLALQSWNISNSKYEKWYLLSFFCIQHIGIQNIYLRFQLPKMETQCVFICYSGSNAVIKVKPANEYGTMFTWIETSMSLRIGQLTAYRNGVCIKNREPVNDSLGIFIRRRLRNLKNVLNVSWYCTKHYGQWPYYIIPIWSAKSWMTRHILHTHTKLSSLRLHTNPNQTTIPLSVLQLQHHSIHRAHSVF